MRRFMWIYGLSLIVVFLWRIMQVFESKSIFVIIDFYPFGRVTKDGKNEGFFGRFSSFIKKRTGIPFNDILVLIPLV